MDTEPSAAVLAAFGVTGPVSLLAGGTGPVFRAGHLVLKRADDPEEVGWKSELLATLPEEGFRLARPVRASGGEWICDGWMASEMVEGGHERHRLAELVEAGRAFHRVLEGVPRPAFFDRLNHRWARAHRVAWGDESIGALRPVAPRLAEFQSMLRPVSSPCQVIHGDLAGNVLFAPGVAPAILDFSPWWAPAGYAEGILLTDALLWFGADEASISMMAELPEFPQMLLRGAIFRMVALNEGAQEDHPEYLVELPLFDRLADLLVLLDKQAPSPAPKMKSGRNSTHALVVVYGPPGSGKSTLARALAQRLGTAWFDRDEFKDIVFDSLGWSDRAWSRQVGQASWRLLHFTVGRLLETGTNVVVETNFRPRDAQAVNTVAARSGAVVVGIRVSAEDDVLWQRFDGRRRSGGRHPGHAGFETQEEFAAALSDDPHGRIDFGGPHLEVDTTHRFPDVDQVAGWVSEALSPASPRFRLATEPTAVEE
jgi:uncharacterized protein (TIGR02569 family)